MCQHYRLPPVAGAVLARHVSYGGQATAYANGGYTQIMGQDETS